jgi:hypothetical protein
MMITTKSWPGNPISKHLEQKIGTKTEILIAGLGIEFTTRRRNKFAGVVTEVQESPGEHTLRLELRVNEAIGYAYDVF